MKTPENPKAIENHKALRLSREQSKKGLVKVNSDVMNAAKKKDLWNSHKLIPLILLNFQNIINS